jgi:hypothetical protein
VLDLLLPHLRQFRRSAIIRRRPHPPPIARAWSRRGSARSSNTSPRDGRMRRWRLCS